MGQEEVVNKVVELEREVAILPEGNITKKKVNDKDAINDAMKKYRELVRPAYDASGRLLENDNSLYDDTNIFAKLIEKMKMSLDFFFSPQKILEKNILFVNMPHTH